MKKQFMSLCLGFACLLSLSSQAVSAANAEQTQAQYTDRAQSHQYNADKEQGRTYQGKPINGGTVDEAVPPAPEAWEKNMDNGYIQCCSYKPCYSYTCECEICPKYVQRKCCRQVPQYYEVQRCRYVPDYYTETCCRYVPEYYCVMDCMECPKYTYHRHCAWEPQYTYKCCPQPCCPEPACVETPVCR